METLDFIYIIRKMKSNGDPITPLIIYFRAFRALSKKPILNHTGPGINLSNIIGCISILIRYC